MYYKHDKNNQIVDIPGYVAEKVNVELHGQGDFISVVLNTVDALVTVLDTEGRVLLFNKACENLTGYTFDEVKGKPFWDLFILPEEIEDVQALQQVILDKYAQFPLHHTNHWKSRDGKQYLIDWSNSVLLDRDGKIRFIVSTGIDVTQKIAARRALEQSESKFRNLIDFARDAIFLCEVTEEGGLSNFIDVNQEACRRLGYTRQEFRQLSPQTIGVLEEDVRQHVLDAFAETGSITFTVSVLAKDGRAVPFEFNSCTIDVNGKTLCMAVGREISERLRVEAQLRESEERYRRLVELSPDAIYIIQDGEIVFANSATAKLLRARNAADVIGLPLTKILHPQSPEPSSDQLKIAYRPEQGSPFIEKTFICIDGSTVAVEVTSSLHTFRGRPAIQGIARNITDKKKMEQEVLKMQKLQSVGKLAGSIAHEYNNLLTVILGNLSVARMCGHLDSKALEILQDMEAAAVDARELTQRLLTFARGGQPVKQPVNLRDLLFKACNNILNQEHINSVLHVPGDLLAVEADEGQLKQVICNIVSNAVQAMPDGGRVDISAENVCSSRLPQLPLPTGQYVKIAISDEGPGIPADRLHHVFDPFYSTKPDGSGLGLATAYSIIKKHGGHLTVESECGKGATFLLVLPAIPSPDSDKNEENNELQGSGRVLLMDDEEAVRKTAAELIRLLGYQVTLAADGEEALQLWNEARSAGFPFDLAVLDLVVKRGTGGKATVAALLDLDPNVRAVVSSGYSGDPVMAEYSKYGFCGCVPKPYTIEQLGKALKLAMQARK